ncbi:MULTISPECIES: VanZ family protein [unclassified Blastococcus]
MVRGARIALALYLVGVAAVTLGQRPDGLFNAGLRTVVDLSGGTLSPRAVEAGANVVMFVPVGLLLCLAFPRARRLALWLLCVVVSASVELYQGLGPGRDSSVRDVVTNGTGAAIGVVLGWAVEAVHRRRAAARGGAD